MAALTQEQKDRFWRDGVLTVEDAVTAAELADLRAVFAGWVEESRGHDSDFGETLDGRARFDLEPGHSAESPALRRVQSPEEISPVYAEAMRNARTVDLVAELIGPAIKFHHGKVNSKLPGAATKVKFHQDFPFEPMTNDDMITALLFIDEVTLENGPLEVVPGTHKGPLYSHWHDGECSQAPWPTEVVEEHKEKIVKCIGKAGTPSA